MYLVFDTETTGFPRKDLPVSHPDQARVIQIAALLLDENFKERACFHTLIKPDGWKISPGAQAVHGITLEDCQTYGITIERALRVFDSLYQNASTIVAHNVKFDKQMISLEGIEFVGQIEFCTMEMMTDICKLPSARGGFKWPKLKEAYQHAFQEELQDAHDALADCRACVRLFKWLREREVVSQPC